MAEDSKVTLKPSKEINWDETDSDEYSNISDFTLLKLMDTQEQVKSENLNINMTESEVT